MQRLRVGIVCSLGDVIPCTFSKSYKVGLLKVDTVHILVLGFLDVLKQIQRFASGPSNLMPGLTVCDMGKPHSTADKHVALHSTAEVQVH